MALENPAIASEVLRSRYTDMIASAVAWATSGESEAKDTDIRSLDSWAMTVAPARIFSGVSSTGGDPSARTSLVRCATAGELMIPTWVSTYLSGLDDEE